jgi:dihydrofolate reductase
VRVTVNLIAAVGRSGQIGLGGHLPWHEPEDLAWFKKMTMNGVVVIGWNTAQTLPALPGRHLFIDPPEITVTEAIELCSFHASTIWVAGGTKTYRRWLPFVDRSFISHIDYDHEADAFMPPLWSQAEQARIS